MKKCIFVRAVIAQLELDFNEFQLFDYRPHKIIQCSCEIQCNIYESTNGDNLKNVCLHTSPI